MSTPVILTDAAAQRVWELMAEDNNFNYKLRASVTGGGCSGMQYGFTFDEIAQDDDTIITKVIAQGSVQLLVDPISLQYLSGAEIDYKEDLSGGQFIITNPNAKTTCGCGSSFSTD